MNMYCIQNVACRRGDFTLRVKDLRIEQGSLTCITGPNGSGKTTLLNLLAFVDTPASGEVEFSGEPVVFDDTFAMLHRRRGVGCLMQNPYLFNVSVYDNIAYGLNVRGVAQAEIRRRVGGILERLALIPLAGRNAHRLSGGEAQRVAVARALVLEADVLILDEPTSGVDREHFRRVEELIRETNRTAGTTVVLSTHSRKQAWRLSGRHVSVINGELHDMVYENVFTGIMRAGRGCMEITVEGGIVLKAGEGTAGAVIVAIDPQNVLISTHPLESSALNHFRGPVSRIEEAGGCLRVFVDIGVPLCASITRASYDALNLRIGEPVDVTFKATAVKAL